MAAVPSPYASPAPPVFTAFPLPRKNEDDFNHILEHVISLMTVAQRLRITATVVVTTAGDFFYFDEESLLGSVTVSTTVMSKIKLTALKI